MVTDKQVEAAWAVIRSCGKPVGAGDGNTYVPRMPNADDIRRALEAAEAVAWEPIESAPHNEQVLLYSPDRGCPTNPERIELGYASFGYGSKSHHSWATRWRPLPQPPKETT